MMRSDLDSFSNVEKAEEMGPRSSLMWTLHFADVIALISEDTDNWLTSSYSE